MNMESADFRGRVFQLRLVVAALACGILIFCGVVVVLQLKSGPMAPGMEFVTFLGAGMLALAVLLQFVILPFIDSAARDRIDAASDNPKPWLDTLTGRTITGCALIEGPAFMCLVGAMLDGQPLGVALGVAAAILMFALHWPSEIKVTQYIESQREKAALARSQ